MGGNFCSNRLRGLTQIFHLHEPFMLTLCVLSLVFSLFATLGNLLVIRALWKSSSIPINLKKLFLSLAFSDLAVGIFSQLMFGVIIAVMLKMASTGNHNFVLFCPTILTVCYFFMFLLACASFLNVTAVAVDRLLAISIHLRYQELATPKRLFISLMSLWITSGVAAFIFIFLPEDNNLVQAIVDFVGLILTSVAYIRIYKIVRYHQNQIQCWQLQPQNAQAVQLHRQKKSAYNALFVYVAFLGCYLPLFFSVISSLTHESQVSFLMAHHASEFLVLLNSSLNPLVYCWRYREIREVVKSTIKKIVYMTKQETA